MTRDFELRQEEVQGGAAVLGVKGELDIGTAPEFRRAVGDLIGAGCRALTVDLADTAFMDSSGLGALVWAEHRLEAVGGGVAAIHASDRLAQLMHMAGVDNEIVVG